MKKSFIVWFSIILAFIFALSCQRREEAPNVINVGVVAEMTGDMPAVGASCKSAAEMTVKEINNSGGFTIDGKKMLVKLFVEDNAGKADQSASAAQKLIAQNNVVAIIGPNASRYAIPASEIAESSKVILITPWSTNPKTTLDARTNEPKKYVFRACFIDPFQGTVLAKFAFEQLNAQKAAILFDVASEYNKGIAEFFKAKFEEMGGKVTAYETYTTNDKDFSAQMTKIKNSAPDIIFLPNYYTEVPLQIQQAHRLGLNVPVLGSDSWGSPELLTLCQDDCEGFYFSTHYSAESATPEAKTFIEAYQKMYNKVPDDVAALTYDSFGLLWTAIRNAEKSDRESIRNALSKIPEYKGVTGTMRFTEGSGDPIKSCVIVQIKGGKFTFFANANP
jgi:branched-chain amino acid transport system substrate-binding protein